VVVASALKARLPTTRWRDHDEVLHRLRPSGPAGGHLMRPHLTPFSECSRRLARGPAQLHTSREWVFSFGLRVGNTVVSPCAPSGSGSKALWLIGHPSLPL
jgi:hypothetical protein